MVYNPRNGIKAKQVFLNFTDATYNAAGSTSLTHTGFTGNKMDAFWGAYYGDAMTLNSVDYSMVNLGFPSGAAGADVTEIFQAAGAAYDTVASLASTNGQTTLTLTTNNGMTVDAHNGKYVIIKSAAGTPSIVYARITDTTAGAIVLDSDVENEFGVAAADNIILLKVPFGLTMTAFHRLDHIATDFELTPPKTETEDTFFLGSEDEAGSQNSALDTKPPSKFTGSVTIRGGVQDLMRLKYGQDSTTPSGTTRYNLGSDISTPVGFHAIWSTEASDTDSTSAITKGVYCNAISITNVGILDSVSADGYAEATVEFEVKGSSVRVEVFDVQSDDTSVNV